MTMNQETIKKVMQELGKRGGKIGGKSTSKAKKRASSANLAKARQTRLDRLSKS